MGYKFWYILMFVLAVVWALLFIERHRPRMGDDSGISMYGGAFDIHKFIAGLRKKYTSPQDHIEIELKLKGKGVYDKLATYVRNQPDHIAEDTINRIWYGANDTNIIETTHAKKKLANHPNTKWSTKKRLSKYNTDLGAVAISLERKLDEQPANIIGEPNLVRRKNRISATLNDHWRIDCTQVEQETATVSSTVTVDQSHIKTNNMHHEVEMEYIASDYWNALERIDEIAEFLRCENICIIGGAKIFA